MSRSLSSNPFPRGYNGFPLNATSIPVNDNCIPHNDNRFPLNDNAFPDNGNDRRVEFPVPGPLAPANDEEFADHKGRELPVSDCFCVENVATISGKKAGNREIPCKLAENREGKAETGSRQTASTATA